MEEWRSVGPKPSVTRALIEERAGQWTVQLWGSCQPTDCDWGRVPLRLVEGPRTAKSESSLPTRGFATWNLRDGRSSRYVVFQILDEQLVVDVYSVFPPGNRLPSYYLTERMRQPQAAASPPPASR